MELFKFIKIDEHSRVPKYKQIVVGFVRNISLGNFHIGDKIPSINMFSKEYSISRDTVEKAYNILKERKIITSIHGKGNYISRTELLAKGNVLFLVNKLSSYKLKIYNSFIDTVGSSAHTDLQIYHCDEMLFLNLLDRYSKAYNYYVIMPHYRAEDSKHINFTDKILNALNKIPKEKLIILDNNKLKVNDALGTIYQDFENDIFDALAGCLRKIERYSRLILVYPNKAVYPYPREIVLGFKKFCEYNLLEYEIIDEICDDIILKKGDLFITIEEFDLVNLIKQIQDYEWEVGTEIGIISYNDTQLKELLGITVISTDFEEMGVTAGKMVISNLTDETKNPFRLIDRASF